MDTISLNSNLSCESIKLSSISKTETWREFELYISAKHWDGDHEHAVSVTSESIFLSCELLTNLAQAIQTWLTSNDSLRLPFAGKFPLAHASANAEFTLIFEDRSDIISSDDKTVVTSAYRIGRLAGEFSFTTDQSCLRLFATDITRTLRVSAGITK